MNVQFGHSFEMNVQIGRSFSTGRYGPSQARRAAPKHSSHLSMVLREGLTSGLQQFPVNPWRYLNFHFFTSKIMW